MAYNLTLNVPSIHVNCRIKYENLSQNERPTVEARTASGIVVENKTVYEGKVLGKTNKYWIDPDGTIHEKDTLEFYYEGQRVWEKSQTQTFEVVSFEPLKNYTDNYIIGKYYEIFPSNNDLKKDFDRDIAVKVNLSGMRKLWEYLYSGGLVARGEMNVSSRGFLASDGFIRAIGFDSGKWSLEMGIFSEAKVFNHVNEVVVATPTQAQPIKRSIKMV